MELQRKSINFRKTFTDKQVKEIEKLVRYITLPVKNEIYYLKQSVKDIEIQLERLTEVKDDSAVFTQIKPS